MQEIKDNDYVEIIYSTHFEEINAGQFRGWGIHLICLSGKGCFMYNDRQVNITMYDALVISRTDLVKNIQVGDDLKVKFIAAPFRFLYSIMPANHYGIKGCIDLFDNPKIILSEVDAKRLERDIMQIKDRIADRDHFFYNELLSSLVLTMVYDLFNFHLKIVNQTSFSDRTAYIVKALSTLLESGNTKQYREVAYYANELNVSSKYLSDTVKRLTGRSVMYLIDQYTVPMVAAYLKNSSFTFSQIVEEMNFASLSYFSRYVKKHFGMSPSEYRLTHFPQK